MEVHYPKSVWKNCYAEHQVPGKTYKKKKKKPWDPQTAFGGRGLIFANRYRSGPVKTGLFIRAAVTGLDLLRYDRNGISWVWGGLGTTWDPKLRLRQRSNCDRSGPVKMEVFFRASVVALDPMQFN